MKKHNLTRALLLIILFSTALTGCSPPKTGGDQNGPLEGTITISGAWALYPLVVRWGEEFQKIHPAVRFDISAGGAGKGMADALANAVDIGMVSREIYPQETEQGAFWVSVAKDAVFLTAAYGLGENVVQGAVNPDEYYIFKPTLKQGKRPIIKKSVGDKKIKMIFHKR